MTTRRRSAVTQIPGNGSVASDHQSGVATTPNSGIRIKAPPLRVVVAGRYPYPAPALGSTRGSAAIGRIKRFRVPQVREAPLRLNFTREWLGVNRLGSTRPPTVATNST
jgi:hypothetical protein